MTTAHLTLTAAGTAPAAHGHAITAAAGTDTERRLIAGDIAPVGVVGFTSWGPTIFEAGAIQVPDDLSRVKLLVQHDASQSAVGIMSAFTEHADRWAAAFHLPEGAEGDDALLKATQKLRDGLSVGMQLTEYTHDRDGNLIVKAARLTEVSLVTVPAFEDARVSKVAANQGGNMKTPQELAAALAAGEITQAEHDAGLAAWNAAQPASVAAAAGTQSAPTAPATPALGAGTTVEAQAAPPIVTQRRPGMDLRAASRVTAEYLRNGGAPQGLSAALADIVPANDAGQAHLRPQFVEELWTADNTSRPIIDAAGTPEPLTGTEVVGWRYTDDPEVTTYTGNKTAVPSNEWGTEPVTAPVQDFAGGWDIARKYIDLGDPNFISQTYRRAVKTYRRNTEAWATARVLAAATALPAAADVPRALVSLGVQAATIGANLSFVKMAPDVWATFANLPAADLPWWLQAQGELQLGTVEGRAGGIRFAVGTGLNAGDILAGDGDAYTYYEVEPPIRVQAENIPNGGVDLGVFGYAALIVNDSRAIFRQPITPAA